MSFYSTSEGGTETTYSTGSSDSHKKESSTTAKTALGLGIAGLAVGLLSGASNCGNGRRNNCGGLLNGLFGNGCCEKLFFSNLLNRKPSAAVTRLMLRLIMYLL